ncbi:MAG: DNA polymerase III subunit alpha [Methylococcales bacterium]|nr:DNA polymerase III subunit alpha [Methylococcales bacterium]
MSSPVFIHLRVHSEFSLVDGTLRIKPLTQAARAMSMPAVAVTERCNLFSLVKFYRAALAQGVKPIVGADVWIHHPKAPDKPFDLTLLALNNRGYTRLCELLALAYREGQHQDMPMLHRAWLEQDSDGLIALSGALTGDVGQALISQNPAEAQRRARYWADLFPERFYLEVQRLGKADETVYLPAVVTLARQLKLPVVATNDVRFLNQEDFAAHEVRVCINQGRVLDDPHRPKHYSDQQYLKTPQQMQDLFADLPEALENSVAIATRCTVSLTLGQNYLPDFPVPDGMTVAEFLIQQSEQGLEQRFDTEIRHNRPDADLEVYRQRLKIELDVIIEMGFPGYFLIVADFIQWAKNHAIPVGPGRGSGAGSLVAYVLNITDLDPIEFDLLFERFLNPERVSMPDFDVDFCMDRRDEVIDYVARHYGRERVAQIITYGSMAAKAVVRDVGRVLGFGYGFVDKLAKLVPFELGMTLTRALAQSEDLKRLYDTEEEVKNLIDMALSLEGLSRNAGKHAGGVVIAPSKITDFTPLYCEPDGSNPVTQYDKDDVEAVGLVKFDFLGLKTLTVIDWALKQINPRLQAKGQPVIDISKIPRDDAESYRLLMAAQTTAVFQLESRGMKELIKKLKPDCFDDIIALVALFRPGPLESGMVDDYIRVKHGARAEYAHPKLEPILKPTNGVILYQEQVMQIARELAGYTLGGADMLRRAMGKKKPEEMAKQRAIFTEGAVANGIDEKIATYIFDLMEKFAGYGFNKSHSAAYALVAYQTAWLKAHYPAEFMAAVMSADLDNTDKIVVLIEECRSMGLTIAPPDINQSQYRFSVDDHNRIVYGLGAIKGAGEAALLGLIKEREQNGSFAGLYDLCQRIDSRKINRRVLEALIKAGVFDAIDANRRAHLLELPTALQVAEQHSASLAQGQDDLFGFHPDSAQATGTEPNDSQAIEPWTEAERLTEEKATLGLFLTGHPIQPYLAELKQFTHGRIQEILEATERQREKRNVRVAGLLIDVRTRQNKNGKTMAFVTLDDQSARMELTLFGDSFENFRSLLSKDALLIAEGTAGIDDYSGGFRLTVEALYDLEQARSRFAKALRLTWDKDQHDDQRLQNLKDLITPHRGGPCPVIIDYRNSDASARLILAKEWSVTPSEALLIGLNRVFGEQQVMLAYH